MPETDEHHALRLRVDDVLRTFTRQETDALVAIDADLAAGRRTAGRHDGRRQAAAGGVLLLGVACGRTAGQRRPGPGRRRDGAGARRGRRARRPHRRQPCTARRGPPPMSPCAPPCAGRPRHRARRRLPGDADRGSADVVGRTAVHLLRSARPPTWRGPAPLWAVMARELIAGECLEILRTGARPRHGQLAAGDPVQDRQVHGRASAAHRRRAGRGAPLAHGDLHRVRAAAGRGVPAAGRPARRSSATRRAPARSTLDDMHGKSPHRAAGRDLAAATAAERDELRGLLGPTRTRHRGPDAGAGDHAARRGSRPYRSR